MIANINSTCIIAVVIVIVKLRVSLWDMGLKGSVMRIPELGLRIWGPGLEA